MKVFNVIMFEFAYRMTMHYDKKFKKWCGIFNKYYERLSKT